MPRSRFKYKTSLNPADAVALILNADDISTIPRGDPSFERANELYAGLISEFEIAINDPNKSKIDIVLPPVMGASDAEASIVSIAKYLTQIGHREDAELLYPDSNILNTNKDGSIHGNTARNASAREEVLQFALYLLKKFPDQCTTIPQWAELIDEKAPLKWPETGVPPLARATVEKLLRKSIKDF
ncbi:hypothetical protein L1D44_04795 [Shewanella sp. Isolate13]|uniref:hypothetical protein n=1 Tax=Shewanella sp. Isolate13 TaxID=2908531 RepID=UPI001EFDA6BB|nr:hypothetical protein [Shewanella sp. Isolate13]MCG9729162.1 hypothetical protein [Shewanella sp. Isolate13]